MTNAGEPYPGLRPFRKDEHAFFFGRYEHTATLYRLLDRGRLLAILGGSGSGKSSLVLAGLLPLLAQEKRGDGTPRWTIAMLRPGSQPMRRLATALLKTAAAEGESIQRVIAGLRHTSRGLATEIDRLLPADREILILVDQFEELFRYVQAENVDDIDNRDSAVARLSRDDETRRFVELLLTAAASSRRRIRVVITMRSDFLGDCARYRGLAEAVSANQYLAPWLNRDQQTEAIIGPLLRGAGRLVAGIFELTDIKVKDWSDLIEPQLVEQLLNDAGDEPDQLPVLQHALRRCWQEASGSRLTLQRYRDLGGWGVILSNHADQVMQHCGVGRATTVERIFRALIQRDGIGRAIRRPCTIAQLLEETGEQEAHIREVIAQFSAADCSFLAPPTAPDELIDIGHEALIRQWRKIAHPSSGWLQEESRDGLIWQLLVFRAQGYQKNPQDVLSAADIEGRQPWFEQHNEHWADRYGGQWQLVDKLMRASNRARHSARRKRVAVRATILAFSAVILVAAVLTNDARRDADKAVAVSIGLQLEFPDGAVEYGDMNALVELSRADEDQRLAFIDEVFQRPALAERFVRNVPVVTRALVGLDAEKSRMVITHVFSADSAVPEDAIGRYARALLGMELAATESVEPALSVLRETSDPKNLRPLGEGLAALPVELTEAQSLQAVEPVLDVLQEVTDPFILKPLWEGLAALPVELSEAQTRQAFKPLLYSLEEATSPKALRSLGEGLTAIAPRLSTTQAQQAVATLLAAMQETSDSRALMRLGEGLAALSVELTEQQAWQAVEPFLVDMRDSTDPNVLKRFAEGLAALPVEFTEAQARQAVDPLLATLSATTDPYTLEPLGHGLAALATKLTEAQTSQAFEVVLAALRETSAPAVVSGLGQALVALAAELTRAQAEQAIESSLTAMRNTTDPGALGLIGQGLAAMPVKLNEVQLAQAADPILAALRKATGPLVLGHLAQGLAALPVELTAAQVEQAVEPMLTAVRAASDADALGLLGAGLAALPVDLTEVQAVQAVKPILAAMRKTSDPDALNHLAEGLAALAAELNAAQTAKYLVEAIEIPWMAGAPSELLLAALQTQVVGEDEELPAWLRDIVAVVKH